MVLSLSELCPHSAVPGAVSAGEGRGAASVGGGEEGGGAPPRKHEAFRRGEGQDTAGNNTSQVYNSNQVRVCRVCNTLTQLRLCLPGQVLDK